MNTPNEPNAPHSSDEADEATRAEALAVLTEAARLANRALAGFPLGRDELVAYHQRKADVLTAVALHTPDRADLIESAMLARDQLAQLRATGRITAGPML